uniref:Predicted protein n=1 Tax=Physcomitrium patens TaxID=3218 RepID=A9U4C4_PHYPA|nr:hypothetical protein PHYPA_024458 [Physcomitrium patens]
MWITIVDTSTQEYPSSSAAPCLQKYNASLMSTAVPYGKPKIHRSLQGESPPTEILNRRGLGSSSSTTARFQGRAATPDLAEPLHQAPWSHWNLSASEPQARPLRPQEELCVENQLPHQEPKQCSQQDDRRFFKTSGVEHPLAQNQISLSQKSRAVLSDSLHDDEEHLCFSHNRRTLQTPAAP